MDNIVLDTTLRISLAQYDIVWEDKEANLSQIKKIASSLHGKSDVLVLPEMSTTGFSMNAPAMAESIAGHTISRIKQYAADYALAICGSFIAIDEGKYYNRAFFITPTDEYYYDKRHLFRMGEEADIYTAGEKRLVFEHKGFKVCLGICYDLRFPVWARNVENEYDLLIYVANWPQSRAKVWNTLLEARALENMCYVCGVNRVGKDGLKLDYSGDSKLINAKGVELTSIPLNQEAVETVQVSKLELEKFRAKFPAWKDADKFELK